MQSRRPLSHSLHAKEMHAPELLSFTPPTSLKRPEDILLRGALDAHRLSCSARSLTEACEACTRLLGVAACILHHMLLP